MTLATTISKASFSGNGTTQAFPLPFPFIRDEDIKAVLVAEGVETALAQGTHYALSGAGESTGGTLVMLTPPATGQALVIYRSPAIVQETDYVENSAFPAETHERALDLLTMIDQALQEQIDRAVLYPVGTPDAEVLDSTDFLNATAANKNAAQAAQTAAAASESAAAASAATANSGATAATASAAAAAASANAADSGAAIVSAHAVDLENVTGNLPAIRNASANAVAAAAAAQTAGDAASSAAASANAAAECAAAVAETVPDATETVVGKVLLASNGGTLAGTVVQGDDSRLAPATESNAGIVALSTQALADAGVDDATAVTPAKLAGRLSALGTAATQNVGTAAGNVVQLDSSGALPAVSGAHLTGIAGIPAGVVLVVASETVPSGYLECNGAAVSRTVYADLFAAIGTTHGTGNGSTTFDLPDYRGRFLRGWDHGAGRDPDKSSRTAMASGGATGDHVGSIQTAATSMAGVQIEKYKNEAAYNSNGTWYSDIGGSYSSNGSGYAVNSWVLTYFSSSGNYRFVGGNETRPINAGVMYCIKY